VIDGHQRLRPAVRLGWKSIPALFVDDLDAAQARLPNLAVSHIHGQGDDGMLARRITDLPDRGTDVAHLGSTRAT